MCGNLWQCLLDWKVLIKEISTRLMSVLELVPRPPHYIGYVDASKSAAGGVWVNGTKALDNFIVWRLEWPQDIQDSLDDAREESLSINDLEMAGP